MKYLLNIRYAASMGLGLLFLGVTLFSCKEDIFNGKNPYAQGPGALVKFKNVRPDPESGKIGSEVTYKVKGLNNVDDFSFYINQVKAEVMHYTDSTITVKVPEHASSGGATIISNEKTYFGPIFQVDGKLAIAKSFDAFNGANDVIKQIVKKQGSDEYYIVGNFTDYENKADNNPVNHIAVINYKGELQGTMKEKGGARGFLNTIAVNPTSNKLFVGGSFSAYDIRGNIRNLTRLNNDGSLDTMDVDLINLNPEEDENAGKDTVPVFNGGLSGGVGISIVNLFYDQDRDQVYAIGNFRTYQSIFYLRSTKGGPKYDYTAVNQLARLGEKGKIDSSFNFNPVTNKSYSGGNGNIIDGVRTPDGDLVIVGGFTSFDSTEVNYIARINGDDGSIDPTFKTGTGADALIDKITYNETTGKFLLTGVFHKFDGVDADGVVMLNADGSVNTNFKFRETTEGRANYAGQLDNGLILVSGRFLRYDSIVRSGFMVLNPDGSLADGYNNTGAFAGQINDMVASETSLDNPGVILVGRFSRFNNKKVGNIVKIALKP